jgi:hypothetical protein
MKTAEKGIVLFDAKFNFFKRFKSITDCGKFFGVASSSFSSVLSTEHRTYKKQYFIFTDDEVLKGIPMQFFKSLKKYRKEKEINDLVISSLPSKRELTKKRIMCVSLETHNILYFNSIVEAALEFRANKGAISESVNYPFKRKVNSFYFFEDTEENDIKIKRMIEILKREKEILSELIELFPDIPIKRFF